MWFAPTAEDWKKPCLVKFQRTWEDAQASAAGAGGHLVTITSADEQQFVTSTFLTGADQLSVFWIGCSDRQTENTFVWVTGEPFSFTNWKSGEPNGWEGADEDYCTINWNAVRGDPPGQWNDTPNVGSTGFDNGANDGPYASIVETD